MPLTARANRLRRATSKHVIMLGATASEALQHGAKIVEGQLHGAKIGGRSDNDADASLTESFENPMPVGQMPWLQRSSSTPETAGRRNRIDTTHWQNSMGAVDAVAKKKRAMTRQMSLRNRKVFRRDRLRERLYLEKAISGIVPELVLFVFVIVTFLSGLVRHFAVKTAFPCVASRASMLYLAGRTHSCAIVCLHAAHIAALREFWADWLPRKQRS